MMKGVQRRKPPKKIGVLNNPSLNKVRFFGGKGGFIKRCGVVKTDKKFFLEIFDF